MRESKKNRFWKLVQCISYAYIPYKQKRNLETYMTAYLNWTCANCHTVNYITVEEKVAILKKLDPKFPVQDEIIKCRNCTSQVVVKAYVPPTLPSADDLDAVDQEEKIRHDTGR